MLLKGAVQMDKKLKVGVVGFGYWGPNLVRNVAELADLVAICDGSADNLAKAKKLYPDVDSCFDIDTMLHHQPDIDAVVVATSVVSHYQVAMRAIKAGKHCFVEKPLTLKSEDAANLVHAADEANVVLMVGHLMMYHSAIEWIKDYIDSGQLGKVLYVYMQRLNLGKVRTEENAFWSLAAHDVSIIHFLLGETPISVSANGADYLNNGIQDVVFANLKFASDKMANIHVSWLDPHKTRKLTVVGTKKMLVFDDMEATEKIWIYDKGVGEPDASMTFGEDLTLRFGEIRVPFVKMREPLAIEVQHFLDCVTSGETPRSDGRDGLGVVRVLEAVDESMATGGKPVSFSVGA
jgi:predicted dehydrogenase